MNHDSATARFVTRPGKFLFLVCQIMLVATIILLARTEPAAAQIPVPIINFGAESTAVTDVAYLSAELKNFSEIDGVVNGMLNEEHNISAGLGFVGSGVNDLSGGTVGQLVSASDMGLQDYQEATTDFERVSSVTTDFQTDPLGSLSILTLFNGLEGSVLAQATVNDENSGLDLTRVNQLINGLLSPSNAIEEINTQLFLPTGTPTALQLEQMNGSRRAIEEQTAITSLMQSSSTTSTYQIPVQTLTDLAAGVSESRDERGDWKANSAILLKILEQQMAATAILGKSLAMNSLAAIDSSGNYGPEAGTIVYPTGP